MPNPRGNPETLKPYQPKWRSGKTQTIRVPIAIASLVLDDARQIDENGNQALTQVIKAITQENEQLKKQVETLRLLRGNQVPASSALKELESKSNTVTSDSSVLQQELQGALHKISEAVSILEFGITPKKQGGTYSSNNASLLKEEVIKAIAILKKINHE